MGCLDIVRYIRGLRTKPNGERFTQTEKLAVVAIAVHQNSATGTSWPSLGELAAYALVTRGSLLRALAALKTAGLVEVEARFRADGGQRSSCYRLTGLGFGAPQERGGAGGATATPPAAPPVGTGPQQRGPEGPRGKGQERKDKWKDVSPSTAAAGRNEVAIVPVGAAPPQRESAPPATQRTARSAGREDERDDGLAAALVAACGPPATVAERARYRQAWGELRGVGARPEEVAQRAEEARRRWQRGLVTPTALAKHWGHLGRASAGPAGGRRTTFRIWSEVGERLGQWEAEHGLAGMLERLGEKWRVEDGLPADSERYRFMLPAAPAVGGAGEGPQGGRAWIRLPSGAG